MTSPIPTDLTPVLNDLDAIATPAQLAASAEPTRVFRTFVFVDLTGFTAFSDREGDARTLEILDRFRRVVSAVAARRGVRVAKWLGDGAMLVGIDALRAMACAAELVARFEHEELRLRAGVASGLVLIFAGDDYLGGTVNLAARLGDLASPGTVAADPTSVDGSIAWIRVTERCTWEIPGLGTEDVLVVVPEPVELPPID